jgi:hypothetical protein
MEKFYAYCEECKKDFYMEPSHGKMYLFGKTELEALLKINKWAVDDGKCYCPACRKD